MAVRATSAQRKPADDWDVLVPADSRVALRAMRRRPRNGFLARQTPDAYIQETRDAAAEAERETRKHGKVVCVHADIISHPTAERRQCRNQDGLHPHKPGRRRRQACHLA